MKLAMFDDHRPGLVEGDRIVDLGDVVGPSIMGLRPMHRMNRLIAHSGSLLAELERASGQAGRPLSDVTLRAPLLRPGKLLFAIGNYREGVTRAAPSPIVVMKPPSAILDPGGTVVLPPHDAIIFHHQAALAVIIGKPGKDIPAAGAMDHVFGYTGAIDIWARGLGNGIGIVSNGFDGFCPMGPWIATRDEVPDPRALSVRLWEDEQLRQDYATGDMECGIAELIAWASRIGRLDPGDVIACGTDSRGVGPLQDGETCTLEIDRIGRMSVKVSDPEGRKWPMRIDSQMGEAMNEMKRTGKPLDPQTAFMRRIG